MNHVISFIRNVLLLENNDMDKKVGLCQFKENSEDFSINKKSITSKDIKLSDLLRRA